MRAQVTRANPEVALYRLAAWLSPAYPVGAFSYSHGLEWAVESRLVHDRASLHSWVTQVIVNGSARSDAIVLAHSMRAAQRGDMQGLREVAEIGLAMAGSAERYLESSAQGRAFMKVTLATWPAADPSYAVPANWLSAANAIDADIAYPVAVALMCAATGVAEALCVTAYLHAFGANLVNAGQRLIPLGQTDGQHVICALEPVVVHCATTARAASLDDIGSAAVLADVASMLHETQATRLFRS